eukprot:TRINITY_DN10333_c0_g1_i1.p1 TRINITY_DN10333_c0_g1~~TRINITY_DN10333_c0_g1_i1.p1  ORF type:complete len:402 (+),score=51.39 TRINITY_DN10333_c0_g1_i1:169-1206(+)
MDYMPGWIAPNMITTIGFFFLFLNLSIGFVLCPTTSSCYDSLPSWYYFACAIFTFIYQTMDNLDGKQARRTDTSSPLGELFDHGCDSLYLLMMSVCVSNAMTYTPWQSYFLLIIGSIIFYASHWEEYHTNHLILGRYANPTEAQCAMMLLLIFAGFGGNQIFQYQIGSFTLALVTVYILCVAIVVVLLENAWKVYDFTKKNQKDFFLVGCGPMIPVVTAAFSLISWAMNSKLDIVTNQTTYSLLFVGLIFSYLCNQLVISRVTKMQFNMHNPILLIPLIGMANVTFFSAPLIPETIALPLLLSVLGFIYIYFQVSVSLQLAHHLNISIFTIPETKYYNPQNSNKK